MIHKGTKELKSSRLLLRRMKEDDALEIYNGFVNQEGFLYYANKKKRTFEEEKKSLENIDSKYLKDDYYNWVIVLRDTNKIIGSINLRVEDINETVEFNYVIDERYSGNGYMTEALNLIKEYSLNELHVNRFQGGCCIENIASKRVMEKCGLECEGILRNYIILCDGYHDMYMFSSINTK